MAEVPYIPVPEGSMRSTDTLFEAIQAHILGCKQCSAGVASSGPQPMGTRTAMCSEYIKIIQFFAQGESL